MANYLIPIMDSIENEIFGLITVVDVVGGCELMEFIVAC